MELKSSQGIPVGDQNNNSFVWNSNYIATPFFKKVGYGGAVGLSYLYMVDSCCIYCVLAYQVYNDTIKTQYCLVSG